MTDNQRGMLLMTLAMAGFAVSDAMLKQVAAEMPMGQVLLAFGGGGALLLSLIARAQRQQIWTAEVLHPAVVLRNLAEVAGTFCIVTALALLPLTTATTIMQATPIAYLAAAAVFLREPVGWRRWMAILLGFVGVLVVIQPWNARFDPAAIWAVGGVVALCIRDIATRNLPPQISNLCLSIWAYAALVPLALVLLWLGEPAVTATLQQQIWLGTAVFFGVSAYWCITGALRTGAVGVVTPFRYTRMLFGVAIGLAFFDESLTLPVVIGAAMILTAGLYTVWCETQGQHTLPTGKASG
ncbi:MAG: DMT family transporter [Rhodobacteraceae bacterium]|jgi:drug/metabolite transporter (DMT)-like permease|nr:DMT family transporter [Paracoccaceae bacterium]